MWRTEISEDSLLHVTTLLGRNDDDLVAVKAGHAGDYCGIISKTPVSVNLTEVGENALDIIQRSEAAEGAAPAQSSAMP